ncbi:hypothetical protein Hanom_Chr03g00278201 [Helianthus anomalus]
MLNVERVCCMCGDVGFPDKIFRCINCHHRFQHWYCSNDYNESLETTELCDWCRTEEIKASKHHSSSKKPNSKLDSGIKKWTEYSGDKMINRHNRQHGERKPPTGAPSPRTSTRRYKLLRPCVVVSWYNAPTMGHYPTRGVLVSNGAL